MKPNAKFQQYYEEKKPTVPHYGKPKLSSSYI